MRPTEPLHRRAFLRKAGSGLAALTPAPALMASLRNDEKLIFGVIGCGWRGSQHVRDLVRRSTDPSSRIALAAVCDIYQPRLEKAASESGAKPYHDYKELLEQKDIDCVVIATPDHWHARMCLDALQARKDIYCEKPWTRTAEEARECHRAVSKSDRILQVGTQHTENGAYWAAKEAIRSGTIGKVVWSQISYSRNSREGEWNQEPTYHIDESATPQNLDWDAFLGPAPRRPFSRERFFRFRKYWDYSGGIASDLHYHKLACILLALGAEFPWRVTSGGGIWVFRDKEPLKEREVPDTLFTVLDMPGAHTILIASSVANASGLPDFVRGHEANLSFVDDGIEIRPEGPFEKDFIEKQHADEVLRIPAVPRDEHMLNFIKCVRSRRAEDLNCGPDLGYKTMVGIALSVQAFREGKVLYWDPAKEEVTGQDPK
jgi:predicted dehydrogenase